MPSYLLFQLITIVSQIDAAIECGAMVRAATEAPNAILAHSATVAGYSPEPAQQVDPEFKSAEMTRNLRWEIGSKARAAVKLR